MKSILTLFCCAANAQQKNDLKRQKLKGEIKTITEYEYGAVPGTKDAVKDTLKMKSVCTYNAAGNRSGFATYSPKGVLQSRSVYTYNDSGRLVDVKRYRGDGGLNVTATYKYDRWGNEEEEREFDSHESLQFRTTFEYGNYDKKGNWLWKATYKNDVPRSVTERVIEY